MGALGLHRRRFGSLRWRRCFPHRLSGDESGELVSVSSPSLQPALHVSLQHAKHLAGMALQHVRMLKDGHPKPVQ